MKQPNFFVIGAPKCGTTSLSEYLRSHPKIFMSTPKEPGFLMPDLSPDHDPTLSRTTGETGYRKVDTLEKYESLFNEAEDSHIAVGEATTHYIMSDVARCKIAEMYPNAKIVIMVRNPVEMVPSLHSHLVHLAWEDVVDFEEAWSTQASRLQSDARTDRKHHIIYTQYEKWGKLGALVSNWKSSYPSHQLMVVFFDDFVDNPRNTYLEILEFLEVPDDGRKLFEQFNPAQKNRSQTLAKFQNSTRNAGYKYVIGAKRLLGIEHYRIGFWSLFRKLNSKPGRRETIPSHLETDLFETFKEDIALLSRIEGKDLSHWSR